MNYPKLIGKFAIYATVLLLLITGIVFQMGIVLGVDIYVLYVAILAAIYFPIVLLFRAWPRENKEEYVDPEIIRDDDIKVANDIAHFKDTVRKALKGNSVAQRDVEMRVLTMVDIELKIRYGLSERELRTNLDNAEFLSKYMGHAGAIIAKLYKRRHDLTLSVPGTEFKKDIKTVLEAMR